MALAVKALFFDVFGTLVDWRSSIAREAEALLKPKGFALDYPAFADAWRGEYQGAMEEVRAGRIAFCKLDVLHRRNLELTSAITSRSLASISLPPRHSILGRKPA
jgi:2-haloacid dehalogenase